MELVNLESPWDPLQTWDLGPGGPQFPWASRLNKLSQAEPWTIYLSFPPDRRQNGIRMAGSFRNIVIMIILLPYPYSTTCHSLISPVLRKCHMKTRAMILCVRRLTLGTPHEHWAKGGACTTPQQYENNYWDPHSVGHRPSITPFNTHPQWEDGDKKLGWQWWVRNMVGQT